MIRFRTDTPALLLSLVVFIFILVSTSAGDTTNTMPPTATGSARHSSQKIVRLPGGVPQQWWAHVQKDIQQAPYGVALQPNTSLPGVNGCALLAANPVHQFQTWFTDHGVRLTPRGLEKPPWTWGLALKTYRAGSNYQHLPPTKPAAALANRVEYHHQGLVEWYVNNATGLEQGFTLMAPPARQASASHLNMGAKKDEILLEMAIAGNLTARLNYSDNTLDFLTATGHRAIHFGKLIAFDANHKPLKAAFDLAGDRLAIRVDAADAVWPITIDPLATSPDWTAESDQANAAFGRSVASAGDVNGDGYGDAIVGSNGRAYLYLGSASGLSSTPDWTAESDQADAYFGTSVASAGDVNGDGYGDVIVGAFYYDNGEINEGRAYLYLGSAAGLSTAPAWTAEGDQADAHFGRSVASAGDVNGDGYGDVIVGAHGYNNPEIDEGRVFLYLGSAAGLSTTPVWTAEGDQAGANYGYCVASAGDVNGDGYGDVIFGSGRRVYLYLGSSSGLSTSPAWTAESDQVGAQFGFSVASAGDVNGDGYGDVIVGAYGYDTDDTIDGGQAYLYLGSAAGLSSIPAWTAESIQFPESEGFGYSVASAGDVNGDGYGDVIIGAHQYDEFFQFEGRAYLYLGSAAGLSTFPDWFTRGNQDDARLGSSVASAGDVNGDGYGDIIVGAHTYSNPENNEGRACLYLGSAPGLWNSPAWTADGDQAYAYFGHSVASAGDVNGDGYGDVIVGAYLYSNSETNEGRAYLYLGSAAGLATAPAWTAEGDQAGAHFGYSVASAGDVNGDGYGDVIIGASSYTNDQPAEGRVYLYLGSAAGLSSTPAWTAESNRSSTLFGHCVASAGDVNGDGYGDVIVGASSYTNDQSAEGRAYLYLGTAAGLNAAPAWTAEGDQAGAHFGYSVASAGDVNGDGYGDVIVGAYLHSNPETSEGRAYLYLGSGSGLAAAPDWIGESDHAGAYFGCSVASAGDINGDGYGDIIVGAHNYSNPETHEGRVYLYLGSGSGLAAAPDWTVESDKGTANFGHSVASAGDVNGDGYGDVIVGAPGGLPDENLIAWVNGWAYLYLGSAAGLSAAPDWATESYQSLTYFGWSVASAGDANGDGYVDLIVGAYEYDNDQAGEGRAFVYTYSPGPPVIANLDGDNLIYIEGEAAQPLDAGADAWVSDADDANFSGGVLLVHFAANGTADDQLTIAASGGITLAGAEVQYNGAAIGDIDAALDGVNGTDLSILFDAAAADDTAVGALIRALRFFNTSQTPATNARVLGITLSNGNLDSSTATVTVDVTAVNDLPTLTSFAGPVDATMEDTNVEITFAEMTAQGDEADVDGTVEAFVVQSVVSGTLSIGTSAATATAFAAGTNDTIDAAHNAYWTPPAGTSGTLDAFAVTAADNDSAASAGSATAQVTVTAFADNPPATSGSGGGGSGCFINTSTR